VLAVACAAVPWQCVHASDWQFAGAAPLDGTEGYFFIDADDLQHPAQGTVRYWLKALTQASVLRYRSAHAEALSQQVRQRVASGQVPRYVRLGAPGLPEDAGALVQATVDITQLELMANAREVVARSTVRIELECAHRRSRVLVLELFKPNGDLLQKAETPQAPWLAVAPDPNAQTQARLACE
jgi:hypothetical protein